MNYTFVIFYKNIIHITHIDKNMCYKYSINITLLINYTKILFDPSYNIPNPSEVGSALSYWTLVVFIWSS